MVKDHSDSERGNPLPPDELLFPINSKGSFICIIPQTTAFVTPVVDHWLEREIACRTSGYGYDLTVKLHSWDFPVYIQHPHDLVISRVIFSGVGDERETCFI